MSLQEELAAHSEAELQRDYELEQAYLNRTSVLAPVTQWLEDNGYASRPDNEGSLSGDAGDEPEASGPLPKEGLGYEDGAGI